MAAVLTGSALGFFAHQSSGYDGKSVDAAEASADAAKVSAEAAAASVAVADRMAEGVEWERQHQYSNKVYLGEAPQYYYAAFPDAVIPTMVVINASGIELGDVWIEGTDGRGVKIDGIQRCTLYSVPLTTRDGVAFVPEAVYFRDPYGTWRRTADGDLQDNAGIVGIPEGVDFGPTGRAGALPMDVEDCSG